MHNMRVSSAHRHWFVAWTALFAIAVLTGLAPAAGQVTAHPSLAIGLLNGTGQSGDGAEAVAARTFAATRGTTSPIQPTADGTLIDGNGHLVTPQTHPVLWYHEGDVARIAPELRAAPARTAMRRYVADGGGLFLSGAGLALVHSLGIEPARPRLGGPGNDTTRAAIAPAIPAHPVFDGLDVSTGWIPVSDRGFPAFADWHGADGPKAGMVLGRAPSMENPLAEFEFGNGRIIVMGWRLAHFSNAPNAYRDNLERLTRNIITYLATPASWQTVIPADIRGGVPTIATHEWNDLADAIRDLAATNGNDYPHADDFLQRLATLKQEYGDLVTRMASANHAAEGAGDTIRRGADRLRGHIDNFHALRREALLANPKLNFDELLIVRRDARQLGLTQNWNGNSSLPRTGYDNEICRMSLRDPAAPPTTVFRPDGGRFAGDVDLHPDGTRLLFSMPGANGRWQIHEVGTNGDDLRELKLIDEPDVDNYDPCYAPDGAILFCSTATFTGVPCVRGSSHVANIYRLEPDGTHIRRLTFDQDHDWCPTMLPSGRVLYLRWEYADIPHFVSRILFTMNPDGTDQAAYYGSNSYWPNAMFFARPIPGSSTRFAAIVSGHHDVPRMGELVLFDIAQGRHEADGALQRIPGRGRPVTPVIKDGLVGASWPKFLHPWPIDDKHFIVSCKPTPNDEWGLYLVDTFDNMLLLREAPGQALFEPIPLRPPPQAPVVPSSVNTNTTEATVYLADIYTGDGLKGVPRGTVKSLRLFSYHFAYQGMGGQIDRIGLDGPWDIHRIVGTVPVEPDGSALFHVPANTPLSLQPLDAEGKALQHMRSWLVAMPGEVLSCVGCHENMNTPPSAHPGPVMALSRPPSPVSPWYGPARGFAFEREVQPVLDRHCVTCHDGHTTHAERLDFTARPAINPPGPATGYQKESHFSPAYLALRRYVRSPTIESDMHLLPPGEFHADTAELVQRLNAEHHGVALTPRDWDALITWIDLGTPYHGTWHELCGGWERVRKQYERRMAMDARYAGKTEDPEATPAPVPFPALPAEAASIAAAQPRPDAPPHAPPRVSGAPPTTTDNAVDTRGLDLGDGITITLRRVPRGEFTMGTATADPDAAPPTRVAIDREFWISACEVSNEQYARFDPRHDSRLEHGDFLQFSVQERGYPVNDPRQPVVRVSWNDAMAFCDWLTRLTGAQVTLPTEAQWEWACRAATDTPLWYGAIDAPFAPVANLADANLQAIGNYPPWRLPVGAVYPWRPAIAAENDGHRVSAPIGSYKPNPWGLYDMHGNAAEWTLSAYRPYPWAPDGRNARDATGPRVIRGGSWYSRPKRATAGVRRAGQPWLPVFDVGFRIVVENQPAHPAAPPAS